METEAQFSREESDRIGLDAYVARVAAAVALPGGGSAAALAGALAAGLGEMLAGLTEGREKFAAAEPRVRELHARLSECRREMRSLMYEDPAAYRALLDSIRLPRDTEDARSARSAAVETAVRDATETPLRTARAAYTILECLRVLIEIGNPHAGSDAAVGAQLAFAVLKGAHYNVLANVRMMRDADYAGDCRSEITDLVDRGREILRGIDLRMAGS